MTNFLSSARVFAAMEHQSGAENSHHNATKAQKVVAFAKKHAVLLTLLLVIVLQFVPNPHGNYPWGGMWIRMQSANLPLADSAAASSVDNYLRQQASIIANQQYPNLPDANKKKVVDDLMQKLRTDGKDQLAAEEKKLAQQIRDHYQYESDGRTFGYMPDIDTYFYLRYARNLVEKGYTHDVLKDGVPWDNHMIAPVGTVADKNWHPYVSVIIFKVAKIFDSGITLMESSNYFPIIFVFLSLIFTFFIAQKVSGSIGGFFAVTVLAVLPAVMGRTPWGHFDTDAYNVFFPVVTVYLLMLALSASNLKKQALWGALAGLVIAVYSNLWSGWWYVFDFVLGAFAVAIIFEVVTHFRQLREGVKVLWNHSRIKKFVTIGAVFLVSSAFFCTVTIGFSNFFEGGFKSALGFTVIKNAALANLWPNVYTTVAELNPANFQQVIASVGGTLMFAIALLGIVLLFFKRDEHGKIDITYSVLLIIWFIGTIYASLKGLRFTLLLGPAFAVAFGCAAGLLAKKLGGFGEKSLHMSKTVMNIIVIVVMGVIIVNPASSGAHMVQNSYGSVVNDIPIMNDAWWNVLSQVREKSQPDAIINSWWDFGHHFKYVADRATTSDGAVQNSPQAHWVGRVLQTDNEREAIGILRMLDCGANSAYDFALNSTQDPVVSFRLVKDIIMKDKEDAAQAVKAADVSEEILKYTHCSPPEDFFIASADMIGKAGVWGHFGLWTFDRAEVWQKWKDLPEDESVPQMVKRFNWSEEDARRIYNEANALASEDAANAWISAWPGYLATDTTSCVVSEHTARCGGSIVVNMTTKFAEVRVQQGVAKAGKVIIYNGNGEKQVISVPGGNAGLVVVMWPTGSGVSAIAATSELADSIFTRMYYMKGLGLKYFKPFAEDHQLIGGNIYVYKVDWEGSSANIPAELQPKSKVEPGAKVALSYIGWTEDNQVFDSSIPEWRLLNVTPDSRFEDFDVKPLGFVSGQGKVIPGFDKRIQGMKKGETRTIVIPPEEAYGTDPSKHALGNKTLHFKIKIEDVQ
jgi:dolichyl-diphosphooligosaccharide--protein glycosyltransferase